jgi:hypothetical protein
MFFAGLSDHGWSMFADMMACQREHLHVATLSGNSMATLVTVSMVYSLTLSGLISPSPDQLTLLLRPAS